MTPELCAVVCSKQPEGHHLSGICSPSLASVKQKVVDPRKSKVLELRSSICSSLLARKQTLARPAGCDRRITRMLLHRFYSMLCVKQERPLL
ncbi:hypothetical protein ILYODFUR_012930 [Ilyodon furcidens]|uniref:Uncharacterized protein n=1 Tax=Ilyodon furcidens TaxID=33524 RepID=A0ABV0U7Z5_9TELE